MKKRPDRPRKYVSNPAEIVLLKTWFLCEYRLTFKKKNIYNVEEVKAMMNDIQDRITDLNTRLSKLARFL